MGNREVREPIFFGGQVWWAMLRYPLDSDICVGYTITAPDGVDLEVILDSPDLMQRYGIEPGGAYRLVQKVERWIRTKQGGKGVGVFR
jgi:hypothetical protein